MPSGSVAVLFIPTVEGNMPFDTGKEARRVGRIVLKRLFPDIRFFDYDLDNCILQIKLPEVYCRKW